MSLSDEIQENNQDFSVIGDSGWVENYLYADSVKESIKEFNNKIHEKGMRNGTIQTSLVYDIVKEVFGDVLCVEDVE